MKAKSKATSGNEKAKTKSGKFEKPEERFRAAFENMLEGVQMLGHDWRYLYINPAAEVHNRRPSQELLGNKYMDMWPGIEATHVFSVIKSCLEERVTAQLENRFVYPDGDVGWFNLSIQPIPEGILILSFDITSRVHAEMQSTQMKRLYTTLSQVNQTIVRVKGRDELYQSICDVAVQFGEFSLAWIGLLDEATGNITPVAANGLDVNHWIFPIVNIHTGPLSDGLIARAIHTSSVVTTENMQRDEGLQVLHDRFHEHGFHAAAVIPFHLRGRVIGAITLVSPEIGLFKEVEEIHLLDEMALDISFALDMIQTETERQQAETAQSESEERFSTAFFTSPVAQSIIAQANSEILLVNDACCSLFGYSREELMGVGTAKLNLWEDPADRLAAVEELQRTGRLLPREATIQTKSGEIRTVIAAIEPITWEGVPSFISSVYDITERKEMEEKLRESEARFREAIEFLPIPIGLADRQGHIIHFNQKFTECYGYTTQDLPTIGDWMAHAYPDPEYREVVRANWQQRIGNSFRQGATTDAREFKVTSKNGNQRDVEIIARGIDGLIVASFNDISARKRAEEALRISEQTAHQMADSLRMVNEISTKITSGLDLERLLQALYEECQRIGDTDQFYVSLYDEATEMLSFPFNYENGQRSPIPSRRNHTVSGFTEYILEHRQTLYISDTDTLPREGALNRKADDPTRSYIGVPLMIKDRVVGALSMQSHTPNAYTPEQIHTLELLATQAAIAIHNAQLFEQAQQEIIERKQAEEKLRQSEALYRQAIEVSGAVPYLQSYYETGTSVRYDFIGEGIRQITGYGPEEFDDKLWDSLALKRVLVEELAEYPWNEAIRRVRSGEDSTWKCEHCIRARDGNIRWVFEAAVELRDENGVSHGSIGLFQDITERKRAEEELLNVNVQLEGRVTERTAELNRANVKLEHANQAKGEFLANMSHELRSPLNSILGLSESLLEQRRGSLNESQQRSLQIIESSGQHLLSLINDVLDLSKMEAGKFDCYPEVIAIDDICNSSLAFVKSQASRKLIQVTYINETGISKCSADPRRLKQILVNLLSNAVKFTHERGHITLQVNANEEQNLLQLSVIDDGIGIAPTDLGRLFQPFVQVDSRLNRNFEGTGLGLALVQKLTDLHGGSVQVESEPGRGSRFTINIPWINEMFMEQASRSGEGMVTTRAEKEGASAEKHQQRASILLAEDNPANILTIAEYLESYGYEVAVAHNGLEVLEQAETKNPDIILMDIQMPAMDGLEATRRLRANLHFTTTPIIALTALAMPGDRERCLAAGANEYMSKPVSLKTLVKTIETLLKSSS